MLHAAVTAIVLGVEILATAETGQDLGGWEERGRQEGRQQAQAFFGLGLVLEGLDQLGGGDAVLPTTDGGLARAPGPLSP